MENKVLTYALARLIQNLHTSWYYDSSCDGECYYYKYTYETSDFTITYDPQIEGLNDVYDANVLVTIELVEYEDETENDKINEEILNISLNKIEEIINRDLTFMRKYFNPSAEYTYECFQGDSDWKKCFNIIDSKKITTIIEPYHFDFVEHMDLFAYHLLLLIDYDESELRSRFEDSRFVEDIDFDEPITIFPGDYHKFKNDEEYEEFEKSFPKKRLSINDIFDKELEYYQNNKIENLGIEKIGHYHERKLY